ncbi:MAG: DUF1015 domain-containing protein [Spirochaetota bacterium]
MAEIHPFTGVRYDEKRFPLDQVTAPPYDVISPSERDAFEVKHPNNVVRLILGKEAPGDTERENKYTRARGSLDAWMREKVLVRDAVPSYYILSQEYTSKDGRRRRTLGIIAELTLSPFGHGVVLPHEKTLSKPKEDRLKLFTATGANLSQVFMLYRDDGAVRIYLEAAVSRPPLASFTDTAGVVNQLWAVPAESADAVSSAFRDKKLYIADGHHRYETAVQYRDAQRALHGPNGAYDRVMIYMTEADDTALSIYPTHRMVSGIPAHAVSALPKAVGPLFTVTPLARDASHTSALGQERHSFVYVTREGAFRLTLKPNVDLGSEISGASPEVRSLDVTVLHRLILEPVFGINAERLSEQTNITYTRDDDEALSAVASGSVQAAFMLPATPLASVLAVADEGSFMPQKSTYFFPKLPSGLVFRLMR